MCGACRGHRAILGDMERLLAGMLSCDLAFSAGQGDLAQKARRGNELMAAGKYSEAAAVYAQLVKALPEDAGLRTNLGMAYHLAGRDREAVEQFERSLKLQPGIIPALIMGGASYMRLGQPAKALPWLEEAARAQPNLKEVRQMLAEGLASLGRHEEAVEHFRRWTSLHPSDPKAWYGLGRAYEALAQRMFEALEKSAPESGYMLALLGRVQASRGQHRSAFYLYRQALSRSPGLRGIHLAIADIYRQTGHADWAELEKSKETQRPAVNCSQHPVECDYRAGRLLQVVQGGAAKRTPESYYWRCRAYEDLAREAFTQLESLPPSVQRHAFVATLQRERGRYADSIKEWQAALKLSPGDPNLEKELAISLRLNEDCEAAQPLLERLLERSPNSAELNYLLGQVLLNRRRPAEAVSYLAKAVEREPDFLPGHTSLGLALLQLERHGEAIPHLEAARPLDTDRTLHFRLARAYQRTGRTEEARTAMTKYRELQAAREAERKAAASEIQITPP